MRRFNNPNRIRRYLCRRSWLLQTTHQCGPTTIVEDWHRCGRYILLTLREGLRPYLTTYDNPLD